MVQGILIGFGTVLGIYSMMGLFARRVESKARGKRSDVGGPRREPEVVPSDACEESPQCISVVQPEPCTPASLKQESPPSEGVEDMKQWFLVRSRQGHLKLSFSRTKTPKAVAGPFPTREDALRAKESCCTLHKPLVGQLMQ